MNPLRWPDYQLTGKAGIVATREFSPKGKEFLLEKLSEPLEGFIDPEVFAVLWPSDLMGSRVGTHLTKHEAFLFLNEEWSPTDAGLVLWDMTQTEAKCGIPAQNTLMVASPDDSFCITPSSTACKETRMIIRIVSSRRPFEEEKED
jgi:hypothetical protein